METLTLNKLTPEMSPFSVFFVICCSDNSQSFDVQNVVCSQKGIYLKTPFWGKSYLKRKAILYCFPSNHIFIVRACLSLIPTISN